MKEVYYRYGRKETENLTRIMDTIMYTIDWRPVDTFSSRTIEMLGLDFPTTNFWDAARTKSNLYAVGVIENEKQYLLAKLKYGI